jgi:hypothetical protein
MKRLDQIPKCTDWVDSLHEIASEQTGLSDFGEESYLQGLRVLLEQYDLGCDLSDIGWYAAKLKMVHVLKRRLLAEQAFKDQPEILEKPIQRPVVITGLVRTGSTALHYLLGRDPNRQPLPYWLGEHPQPRPPQAQWAEHPEFKASKNSLDMMFQFSPELKAVHYMAPDWPEECGHLMSQTFTDDYWECGMSAPHYVKWYEHCDMVPTYRRHQKLLQLIGSNEPDKPWLLKYPVHMKHLRSFLEVYPDALVIWTHRDPSNVLSSYASLLAGFRALNVTRVDRNEITQEQMEIWASAAERAIDVRANAKQAQFYDLHFSDFVGDPVGSARKIYEGFDIEWTDDCEQALRAWTQENPQEKHGKHGHTLEAIETTREEMLERFSTYINHFNVAVS